MPPIAAAFRREPQYPKAGDEMSRLPKRGLDYFPLDAGFFRDSKIRLLRGEHKSDGVEVYIRLLCKIYEENGYFLPWNANDDYALLADETGHSEDKIRLIVSTCLNRSLFDNTLFKSGNVLSSRGIQRRFFSVIRETRIKAAIGPTGRHTTIEKDLCLLTADDLAELNKTHVWLEVTHNDDYSTNNGHYSTKNEDKSTKNALKKSKEKINIIINNNAPAASEQAVENVDNAAINAHIPKASEGFMLVKRHYEHYIGNLLSPDACDDIGAFLESGAEPELLCKAINISVDNNKRNWRYARKIIMAWIEAGVMTVAQSDLREANYQASKQKGDRAIVTTPPKQTPPKRNRFANFGQRERDYAALERMERQHLQDSLKQAGE